MNHPESYIARTSTTTREDYYSLPTSKLDLPLTWMDLTEENASIPDFHSHPPERDNSPKGLVEGRRIVERTKREPTKNTLNVSNIITNYPSSFLYLRTVEQV